MVRLVQVMFRDGTMTEEIAWTTMVLLQKWKGEYRGIGIVEVLWKVCSVVVNCRLKRVSCCTAMFMGSKKRGRWGRQRWRPSWHRIWTG